MTSAWNSEYLSVLQFIFNQHDHQCFILCIHFFIIYERQDISIISFTLTYMWENQKENGKQTIEKKIMTYLCRQYLSPTK